jgi:hypothetical protein
MTCVNVGGSCRLRMLVDRDAWSIPGLGERVRLYAVRAEVAELDVGPLV